MALKDMQVAPAFSDRCLHVYKLSDAPFCYFPPPASSLTMSLSSQAKAPDARIINLETAVTTSPQAWLGKGINYRMHPGSTKRVGCLVPVGST
jgi:hypothetical protein